MGSITTYIRALAPFLRIKQVYKCRFAVSCLLIMQGRYAPTCTDIVRYRTEKAWKVLNVDIDSVRKYVLVCFVQIR